VLYTCTIFGLYLVYRSPLGSSTYLA